METATSNVLKMLSVVGLLLVAWTGSVSPEKKYDVGVTDREIRVGNIMPYSGPASYFSARENRSCVFQDDQRAGGRQRSQDQFHFL
jgi:hypothetical protein